MIGIVPANTLVDYVGQELGVSDWFQVDQDRICLLYTSDAADE